MDLFNSILINDDLFNSLLGGLDVCLLSFGKNKAGIYHSTF